LKADIATSLVQNHPQGNGAQRPPPPYLVKTGPKVHVTRAAVRKKMVQTWSTGNLKFVRILRRSDAREVDVDEAAEA
jgi:hypothetical protein